MGLNNDKTFKVFFVLISYSYPPIFMILGKTTHADKRMN